MHTFIRRCFLVIAIAVHGMRPGTLAGQSAAQAAAQPGATSSTTSSAWTVEGPAGDRWVLFGEDKAQEMEFVVTAGGDSLKNLRLERSTLVNEETGATLGVSSLRICGLRATECPDTPATIPAGRSSTLRLRVDRAPPEGVYKGTLRLAADGGADTKALNLTVERSSRKAWFLGGLAIFAGIVLAWLVNHYLRQLSLRNAALLPAAQLNDAVKDLLRRVDAAIGITGVPLDTLRGHLAECAGALSVAELEERGFIPGRVPSFFGGADAGTAYQQYLSEQNKRILVLDVIVRRGVGTAAGLWPGASAEKQALIRTALQKLDVLPLDVHTVEDAETRVKEILAETRDISDLFQKGVPEGGTPPAREILVQIQRVNLTAWGIWAVLTLLVGLVALVFTNHGFGTPLDYCKCLLWGLGLPMAGQQLQQLTSSSVSTAFNLAVPT